MNCQYTQQQEFFICQVCGHKTKIPNLIRNCKPKADMPSLITRTANFVKSTTKHVLAGNPKSSQEEINARLNICKDCVLFQKYSDEPIHGVCMHQSCGCNIRDTQAFLNKLAWKDQKCPLDKW